MSDSQVREENSYKGEAKYRQFTAAVEKALKNFEGLTEWHDLISALARINKVLLAYMQYPVVPLQLTVCKRLTQCLHPNLPSGVHLKTLDVYVAIFDRISSQGLLSNLLVYSSGLFPLLSYASMSVRPHLLTIYEKYFLPLGMDLVPALHGFVLGLLPGLEDESEHSERICNLLNALSVATDESSFFHALWQCVRSSPDYRLPAVTFLLGRLNKKLSAADQVHCMGGSLPLVVSGVCAALQDKNVLVQRTILDVIIILFPFHTPFLLPADITAILSIALETLLKRDASLSRRFYCWLLGPNHSSRPLTNHQKPSSSSSSSLDSKARDRKQKVQDPLSESQLYLPLSDSSRSSGYFVKHSKTYLLKAVQQVLDNASNALHQAGHSTARLASFRVECVYPYRILRALYDQPEVSNGVMEEVMMDLVWCLKSQLDLLGLPPGSSGGSIGKGEVRVQSPSRSHNKKSGKRSSLKAEVVQSANLLFGSMGQDFVWQWMEGLVVKQATTLASLIGDSRRGMEGEKEGEGRVKRNKEEGEDKDSAGRGSYVVFDADIGRVDGENHHRLREERALSPVSEMLESQLIGRKRRNKAGLDQSSGAHWTDSDSTSRGSMKRLPEEPGLTDVLSLIKCILYILPKDVMQGIHVCRLLLQVGSLLHSCQDAISMSVLDRCLSTTIQLLHDSFLGTPVSSINSTPSSTPCSTPVMVPSSSGPSFRTPQEPPSSSSSSVSGHTCISADSHKSGVHPGSKVSPTLTLALGLSLEELKLKIYEEYTGFFASFAARHINGPVRCCLQVDRGDFCRMFSSCCQVIVLLAKLLSRSQVVVHMLEDWSPENLPDWLTSLVQVCGRGGGCTLSGRGCRESIAGSVGVGDRCARGSVMGGAGAVKDKCDRHVFIDEASSEDDVGAGLEVWLVGLETLLTLLELATVSSQAPPPGPLPSPVSVALASSSSLFCLLPMDIARKVIFTHRFVKTVTSHLWSLLSPESPGFHAQVVPLLAWLRSLVTWNRSCEAFILDQFSSQGLDACQRFTVLWHHLPSSCHETRIRPFHRAILRMLEGLHSADTAVQKVTWSWVKMAMSRGGRDETLTQLLHPVLRILLEPCAHRKPMNEKPTVKVTLSREDAEKDMDYAKYYFKSLGIENPYAPNKKEQYTEQLLYYSRQLDSGQLLYALSLLQSIILVDPEGFVCAAGNLMVDVMLLVSGWGGSSDGGPDSVTGSSPRHTWEHSSSQEKPHSNHRVPGTPSDSTAPPSPSPMVHKSLLELILSLCTDLLRSEYHPSLKVSAVDQLEGLKVKVSCASLLSVVLHELLRVLAGKKEDGMSSGGVNSMRVEGGGNADWKVFSPSFVSALIALCDVQVVVLLVLGKSVQWWEDAFQPSSNLEDGKNKARSVWSSVASELTMLSEFQLQSGDNPIGVTLHSLCSQLLRAVQCLVVLESQLSLSLEGGGTHPRHQHAHSTSSHKSDSVSVSSGVRLLDPSGGISSSYSLPAIRPSSLTAGQPYFREFLLHVLRSSSKASFHDDLLHMFSGTISNLLHQQLLELAPNVVKQLCANIEQAASPSAKQAQPHCTSEMHTSPLSNGHFCVIYLKTILDIVWWCLFGKGGESALSCRTSRFAKIDSVLFSRLPNPLYNILQVVPAGSSKEILSPILKQPSAMSWLFGMFSVSQKTTLSSLGGSGGVAGDGGMAGEGVSGESGVVQLSHGVDSLVGQHVLMLLPAIYNAMATIWTNIYSECAKKRKSMERRGSWKRSSGRHVLPGVLDSSSSSSSSSTYKENIMEDLEWLFGEILCNLAELEPTAFFSSISHIWLEWNISNKSEENAEGGDHRSGTSFRGEDRSWGMRQKQEAFIDILHHVKVLPLEVLLHCLQSTLADIARIEDYESSLLRQQYLLHFLYKYISSSRQSSKELNESRMVLVSFLKDYHGQVYNPTPQALIRGCSILCMIISILHVVVCRVPPPSPKTQKKERKDLQEVCHKLCETLSMVANVGISHPDYVLVDRSETTPDKSLTMTDNNTDSDRKHAMDRDSAIAKSMSDSQFSSSQSSLSKEPLSDSVVKRSSSALIVESEGVARRRGSMGSDGSGSDRGSVPKRTKGKKRVPASMELLQPALQALTVLSNVLAHFIDCVFDSSEKDKVTSLLKAVLLNVWPHLHNHSHDFQESYTQSSKLLASLSGFQVTRKSWRKEAFDLFLAPDFFSTNLSSLLEWKVIVDNLMTQDQVTFRDLLTRLHSTSAAGVVNIFSSLDQEIASGSILLKRMAFALFSGETDQYVKFLPDIQEKLSEYLRVLRYPSVCCEIFLTFRVLLLKFSPHHLLSFWPAMTAELISQLTQLEADLVNVDGDAGVPSVPRSRLQLYLSACKLLDTALALPPQCLPHFQWLKWGFIATESEDFIVAKLCKSFQITEDYTRGLKWTTEGPVPPFLGSCSVSSLQELKPFFAAVMTMHLSSSSVGDSSHLLTWKPQLNCNAAVSVEEAILQDFLESSV